MRLAISLLATTLLVAGCGQSGALRHANDPSDRAHYLLYSKNTVNTSQAENKAQVKADGSAAASELTESK